MLVLITILVTVASIQAAVLDGGTSLNSRTDDGHGNYAFNYEILDPLGAKNGRYEEGDAFGNKRGYYHLTDIDGRARRVDYIADEHGFRTFIQTNEPGTATSEPAGAVIKSDQDKIHAVSSVVVAPPPEPIHTVYTTDLLPQPQPKVVRIAVPVAAPHRVSHIRHHYNSPHIARNAILPIARPPIPLSHSTRLFPVTTTRTRIVPANHVGVDPYASHHTRIVPASPYASHHTRIVPASPYASHHTRIVPASPYSYGTRFNNGISFVSAPVISRGLSHHTYLPIR